VVTETPEHAILLDALGSDVPSDAVTLISREPLGAGSVAGFTVGAGEEAVVYYVDTSRRVVPQETGLLQGTPDDPDVRVWLHPADPHLPALAPVAFSHAAESLLARLDIAATGAPEIVAYRPGRRAVLRVATAAGPVWLKVLPPTRTERIVRSHRLLADAGIPLPMLHGWSAEGLLVLASAPGTPVTDAPWRADALLDQVDDLRARFAGIALPDEARTHLDRRLEWYMTRLLQVLPVDAAARVSAIAQRARDGAAHDSPAIATIHGDLHFGQLFLDDAGGIAAVIDVDTAGTGESSEDAGAFVAHAVASALLTPPDRAERVWELARGALRRWSVSDGAGVAASASVHLLGHVLGAWERGDTSRAPALLAAAEAVSRGDADALGAASRT
jgi:hypothetical protein